MAVLLYQIGIFVAIQIAAIFGKNARNVALVLISIFTILQIFMSWLLLLQFITILIAFIVSESIIKKNESPINHTESQRIKSENIIYYSFRDKNGGTGIMKIDLNDPNLDPKLKEKALLQQKIKKSANEYYENNPEFKKVTDDFIKNMFKK